MSSYLTVSANGQVTLDDTILAHLGVQPVQSLAAELCHGGRVELRPVATHKISDAFGILKRPDQPVLTIEEMNEVIARAWAGER